MKLQIKICGITSEAEAIAVAGLGATHLGLNFYPPSPRYLTRHAARAICAAVHRLPERPLLVGVFVNASPHDVLAELEACGLDLAQLSGDEPPEMLRILGARAFKAVRLAGQQSLSTDRYLNQAPKDNLHVPELLLDAQVRGMYGGTGRTGDWTLAATVAQKCRVMLAGGLTPDNVAAAVRAARPWGVDVASGVESAPGVKDVDKVAAFIANARAVSTPEPTARR